MTELRYTAFLCSLKIAIGNTFDWSLRAVYQLNWSPVITHSRNNENKQHSLANIEELRANSLYPPFSRYAAVESICSISMAVLYSRPIPPYTSTGLGKYAWFPVKYKEDTIDYATIGAIVYNLRREKEAQYPMLRGNSGDNIKNSVKKRLTEAEAESGKQRRVVRKSYQHYKEIVENVEGGMISISTIDTGRKGILESIDNYLLMASITGRDFFISWIRQDGSKPEKE